MRNASVISKRLGTCNFHPFECRLTARQQTLNEKKGEGRKSRFQICFEAAREYARKTWRRSLRHREMRKESRMAKEMVWKGDGGKKRGDTMERRCGAQKLDARLKKRSMWFSRRGKKFPGSVTNGPFH